MDHHKHLGVTLSHDTKWHEHINSILSSAARILGMMRKLKYSISRKSLNQIYISFLRPVLEYSAVVWDGCTLYEKESLEKIRHEAARIVTGLTRSVSIEKLYSEIGWLSLSERRKYQKLIITFKSKLGMLPSYLSDLFPQIVGTSSRYNLRNASDYVVFNRRTERFSRSFIPSSVELWNSLPEQIRNADTLSTFKHYLLTYYFSTIPFPKYFAQGNRQLTVLHARLRNGCSSLNFDLYRNRIRTDSVCDCGSEREDAEHFFFQCHNYNKDRLRLFQKTRRFHPLNLETLLYGRDTLSYDDNLEIFKHVQQFIRDTHRFNNS